MNVLNPDMTYGEFFRTAPAYNPRAELITGKVCGIQVESIEDPLVNYSRINSRACACPVVTDDRLPPLA